MGARERTSEPPDGHTPRHQMQSKPLRRPRGAEGVPLVPGGTERLPPCMNAVVGDIARRGEEAMHFKPNVRCRGGRPITSEAGKLLKHGRRLWAESCNGSPTCSPAADSNRMASATY